MAPALFGGGSARRFESETGTVRSTTEIDMGN